MARLLPWLTLIALAVILGAISSYYTSALSDKNLFFKGFVNHELLATLGFILAITLASAANLHLELNKIEDATGRTMLRTRSAVRRSVTSLVVVFALGLVLVVIKPLLPEGEVNEAYANSAALLLVYFNLSVLHDLARAIFAIPTINKIRDLDLTRKIETKQEISRD